jgi:malate dehydrogenase
MKISIIGAGMVGSTTAVRLLDDGPAGSLVLVDVLDGLARAVSLDLCQSASLRGHTIDIRGSSDYGPTENSDLVIITAGLPRKPGQSRSDLLATNAEIVAEVAAEVASRSPTAIVLVVSNPLDEMTTLTRSVTGFPSERVVGMAGALDTARYRYFVAAELGVAPGAVEALVLGSHGETMVPLPRTTTVNGRPLSGLLSAERIEAIVERTREGGAEIVGMLPRGSAWMAPSAAVADMVKAIARDERRVISCCAYLRGEYGLTDVYLGVPTRLGRKGVVEIVELPLTPDELGLLRKAAETVRSRVADLTASPFWRGDVGPGPHISAPERKGSEGVDALREESRIRRAVEQVLWKQGTAKPEEVDALTKTVMERMSKGSVR